MSVEWTRHRFSGGVLALDVTNTVVHRQKSGLRFDRFADATEIARFSKAASALCAEKLGELDGAADGAVVIALREATDALFRGASATEGKHLPTFLRACAAALDAGASRSTAPLAIPFESALATSALALLNPSLRSRVRVCANCDWLFLDRSRNASRIWCDMAVCGNRAKAKRHYRRSKAGIGSDIREEGHA